MSQQTFASFYDEFLNRPENANLVESINVADSEESFAAKAVEVGKAHGFSFTVDEVKAIIAASNIKQFENVELSDQELEAVAGGMDGISRLIAVTQMKSNNANDEARRK